MGMKTSIREFNKLMQISTVEKYQEKFEDLRAKMLYLNPTLREEHFVQSYISGLKEELVPFIDLSHPVTLEQVYEQARLHEQALSIMWRKSRTSNRVLESTVTKGSTTKTGYSTPRERNWQPTISREVFEQRKAAGLCYKCGDKFQPWHKCQA